MLWFGVAPAQQQSAATAVQDDEQPIYARYLTLFRRLITDLSENQDGRVPQYRTILKGDASLSGAQMDSLVLIAADCMQKVAEIEHQAREIVQAYRAQNRSRGQSNNSEQSTPASSLQGLTKQRNDLILEARQRLRLAFGDAEFERFDRYLANKGNGRRVVFPSRDKKPLPITVTIVALNSDGLPQKQFTAGSPIFIEIRMMNNSTQAISIRSTEFIDWFQLLRLEKTGAYAIEPLPLWSPHDDAAKAPSVSITELRPGQSAIVGRVELGGGRIKLRSGEYRCVPHEQVILNRPPDNSELLHFIVGDTEPITFEIMP